MVFPVKQNWIAGDKLAAADLSNLGAMLNSVAPSASEVLSNKDLSSPTNIFGAIGVQATKNATQAIAAATPTLVTFPTEDWDSSNFHDLVTNNSRITIPAGMGGKYLVKAKLDTTGGSTPGLTALYLYRNGGIAALLDYQNLAADLGVQGDIILILTAGDYLEVVVTTANACTLQSNLTDYTPCYFSAIYLGI